MDYNYYEDEQNEDGTRSRSVSATILILIAVIFMALIGMVYFAFSFVSDFVGGAVKQDTSMYNIPVTATIIENRERFENNGNGGSEIVYTPVYEYEYGGNTYTVAGEVSSVKKKYEVGEKAKVRIASNAPGMMYDPEKKKNTVFKDVKRKVMIFDVLTDSGPFLLIFAIFVLFVFFVIRAKKRGEPIRVTFENNRKHKNNNDDDYTG